MSVMNVALFKSLSRTFVLTEINLRDRLHCCDDKKATDKKHFTVFLYRLHLQSHDLTSGGLHCK